MKNILNKPALLEILNEHEYEMTGYDINYTEYLIRQRTLVGTIEYLLDELSISKHSTILQTCHFLYTSIISKFRYCISKLDKDSEETRESIENYYNRLVEVHKLNLEYEVEHPPIIYKKLVKKPTSKVSRVGKDKTVKSAKPKAISAKRITIINLETNKEVNLERELALSIVRDKPFKFKVKDD